MNSKFGLDFASGLLQELCKREDFASRRTNLSSSWKEPGSEGSSLSAYGPSLSGDWEGFASRKVELWGSCFVRLYSRFELDWAQVYASLQAQVSTLAPIRSPDFGISGGFCGLTQSSEVALSTCYRPKY